MSSEESTGRWFGHRDTQRSLKEVLVLLASPGSGDTSVLNRLMTEPSSTRYSPENMKQPFFPSVKVSNTTHGQKSGSSL